MPARPSARDSVSRPAPYTPPARSARPRTRSGRVEALDGLRGLAVLGVVAVHTGLLSWGWAGVDLFFALSGFLITGILLDAKEAGGAGWGTYGKPFYARRALRILPLAYAFMALVFFVAPGLHLIDATPKREQLWYWLYISNWWVWPRSDSAWRLSHYWSLAVEEQFYLCWPWVVMALSRKRLGIAAATLLLAAPLFRVVIVLMHLPPQVGHTCEGFTLTRFDGLAAGALLAVLARSDLGLERWRGWFLTSAAAGALGFAATLMLASPDVAYVGRYTALGLLMGGVVALALVASDGIFGRALSFRPLRWIGTVSYCTYIIHIEFAQALRKRGVANGPLLFAATLGITLVFASASWYAFERQTMSLKRLFPMPSGDSRPSAAGDGIALVAAEA